MLLQIDYVPDTCPICQRASSAVLRYACVDWHEFDNELKNLQVVYQCPSRECHSLFIAHYDVVPPSPPRIYPCGLLRSTETLYYTRRHQFSQHVLTLSPDFCRTYQEAEIAELNKLSAICGVGYRKALEFLIKDFIVKHIVADDAEEVERVKQTFLGSCIKAYIDDPRIRAVAERAAWLGNDEAHYVRRWQNRDLNDLKRLINMTVSWIELVLESAAYQEAMPNDKSDPAAAT